MIASVALFVSGVAALYLWMWLGLPVPFLEMCEAVEERERLSE